MPTTTAAPPASPLPVIPMSVRVQCPGCSERSNLPSAAVGLVVPCLSCGRALAVVLTTPEADAPRCEWCAGPLPPWSGKRAPRYCSDRCRADNQNERNQARRSARLAI